MMLNNNAVQNVLTSNPVTNSVHSKMISALMTSKKSPNVMMVTGNVNKINSGLTKMLSNPSTTATITDVIKLSTTTPGMKCAITMTSSDVIKILSNIPIILNC